MDYYGQYKLYTSYRKLMKMPLGIIVNENQNPNSADTWALVLNDMVINTIIATGNQVVGSWLISSYDYIVDLTIQGQNAGVGWTYSPGGNTFTTPPPPPINWQDIVQEDFDGIMSCLYQIIQDAGSK